MIDQHKNPIPLDLVFLDIDPSKLTSATAVEICSVDWYEADGHPDAILISFAALTEALGWIALAPTAVSYFRDSDQGVTYIATANRRWSDKRGFYNRKS